MKERHQIIKQLGSGGFGSVFLAKDTQLDRDVAIKRLKADSYVDHIELKEQLLMEAKVLAGLRHPNIVAIFDVIETETGGDIIMELIDGRTLDAVIKEDGNLSIEQFLFVATQLLSAIATAHENDILHCDLKPSNLMLSDLDDGNYQTTVLDFGLSPSRDDAPKTQSSSQRLVGSIYFMSPEVMESGVATKQSDIYSLGCLFYYMLTGHHPFEGESPVVIMASHMRNAFTPLKELQPEFPDSLCEWVESHIKYKPEERIESCRDSLNQLLQLEGIKPLETLSEVYPDSNLSNTMLHSLSSLTKASVKLSKKQKEEFEKSKRGNPATTPQDLTPMAERVTHARPQDLWYFSIDDVRKGPVPFEKVCELIAEGFVRSNDPIYHHRIGQWTPAIQIPEFKEEFDAAKAMPPRPKRKKKISLRNSQRIRAQRAAAKAAQIQMVREEVPPFPAEIVSLLVISCLTVAALFVNAGHWQAILLISSCLFILSALIITRIRMNQNEARWLLPAIFLPAITDLFYAVTNPKDGAQGFILLLLGIALFVYASAHRYANDVIGQLNLEFVSTWLQAM